MPCYSPLKGYRAKVPGANGKYGLVFKASEGFADMPIDVPCGQCIGCRLERSRQWAIRIMHEAKQYDQNSFITLTYNEEHVPPDGSLHVDHFQKFMKRLRKNLEPKKIRFFHCGEYGDNFSRPHYHAIIFGYDFPDREGYRDQKVKAAGSSKELELLWPFGFNTVGDVTFESAQYVAGYCLKKVTGGDADEHYAVYNRETGEVLARRVPEYVTMSRRPGIGNDWIANWHEEVYRSDSIIVNGREVLPPKYYDRFKEKLDSKAIRKVRYERRRMLKRGAQEPERLEVRQKCAEARWKNKNRSYENG